MEDAQEAAQRAGPRQPGDDPAEQRDRHHYGRRNGPALTSLRLGHQAGAALEAEGLVAGERQRGTLEVALARPISRRALYISLLVASFAFVAISIAALLAGSVGGATFAGVVEELAFRHLPLLWLNSVLLFGAFAAIALAAASWALGAMFGFRAQAAAGALCFIAIVAVIISPDPSSMIDERD